MNSFDFVQRSNGNAKDPKRGVCVNPHHYKAADCDTLYKLLKQECDKLGFSIHIPNNSALSLDESFKALCSAIYKQGECFVTQVEVNGTFYFSSVLLRSHLFNCKQTLMFVNCNLQFSQIN